MTGGGGWWADRLAGEGPHPLAPSPCDGEGEAESGSGRRAAMARGRRKEVRGGGASGSHVDTARCDVYASLGRAGTTVA